MSADLDLGHGHTLRFVTWEPDMALNPRWAHLSHMIRTDARVGAEVVHKSAKTGEACPGYIALDTELALAAGLSGGAHGQATWHVVKWDPLTLEPSVLCRACGDHGFIREGRWVPA